MPFERKYFVHAFLRVALALLLTLCLIRVYEYFTVASKLFVSHAFLYEVTGLLYDVWLWLQYCSVMMLLYLLASFVSQRLAIGLFHTLNVLFLVCSIGLLITFSERTTPFDHELFTRSSAESLETSKQMLTSGVKVYVPFVIYIVLYFFFSQRLVKRWAIPRPAILVLGAMGLLSLSFVSYSEPSPDWFSQTAAYYLTTNKLSYWMHDSYAYFKERDVPKLTDKELLSEVAFYQQQHPFQYTSTDFPLLHQNNSADVLGPFFNLQKTPPNIVILVVEGLSKDFTGQDAYAGSFTPFLDSLSNRSLVWNNFLSTAPGTFASQPAISGSVPYGKKGFSIMNIMPDHLSILKIFKRNGYHTNFMTGFDPDFDNMGGFIRLQGTDFVLSHYGPQYKMMGIGKEGWSMGYPDDALYQRSFEVLDSIHTTPYLSIYHTGTTHMPYLFEQKPTYDKLFDVKVEGMKIGASTRRTLKQCKDVLVTFMFSDDCIRKFFSDYAKRPEYSNTIFLITGDHHIGSFPSTGVIDDYHVPLIVYSPLLKAPHRFASVNSHNNIAPTLTALLQHNYPLQWQPQAVHWLGDVMDTCTAFRNTQSMAFMAWSREIKDYLYKDYFLSGNQLYKLTPQLLMVPYKNDTLKSHMTRLRENFRVINDYVCERNKVFPGGIDLLPGKPDLVWLYSDTAAKQIFSNSSDTSLAPFFKVPKEYKYLYVETKADVNLPPDHVPGQPTLRFALIDNQNNNRNYLYWSKHDVDVLGKDDFIPGRWNHISSNDMFTLGDYRKVADLVFELATYTDTPPNNFKIRGLDVKVYGIR